MYKARFLIITSLSALSVVCKRDGMEASFNVCTHNNIQAVSSVELKLYKRAVSLRTLQSEASLQLSSNYSSSNNYSFHVMVLAGAASLKPVSSMVLTQRDILSSRWMDFHGLSNDFNCTVQHNFTSEFKVKIVARNNCSNQIVDPRELGLFTEKEDIALLVVYSRSSGAGLMMQDTARVRRHIEKVISKRHHHIRETFDPTVTCGSPIKYNVSSICLHVCISILILTLPFSLFSPSPFLSPSVLPSTYHVRFPERFDTAVF